MKQLYTLAFLICLPGTALAATPGLPKADTLTQLSQFTWSGVSLGEPESDVINRYGDAGFTILDHGLTGNIKTVGYTIDHGRGMLYVDFRNGRVSRIGLAQSIWEKEATSQTDPHNVTLAMTVEQLQQQRGKSASSTDDKLRHSEVYNDALGVTWTYTFVNGKMTTIFVQAPDAVMDSLSGSDPVAPHSGTSFDNALLNGAADELSGARNERNFLLTIRCLNGGGMWREDAQALVEHEGKKYDVLNLSCYRSAETRKLYFDITPFFGKL